MQRLLFALGLLLVLCSFSFAGNPRGHWSFPGSIQSHLQRDHGISTAGLTYEQMLLTHDRIHQSTRGYTRNYSSRPTTRFFRWRR